METLYLLLPSPSPQSSLLSVAEGVFWLIRILGLRRQRPIPNRWHNSVKPDWKGRWPEWMEGGTGTSWHLSQSVYALCRSSFCIKDKNHTPLMLSLYRDTGHCGLGTLLDTVLTGGIWVVDLPDTRFPPVPAIVAKLGIVLDGLKSPRARRQTHIVAVGFMKW